MGKAKQRGAAANTSHRNAVEAQQDPVKALAQAIKNHIAVSRHDRTPDDAIRTLVNMQFFSLENPAVQDFVGRTMTISENCRSTITAGMIEDSATVCAMIDAYLVLVEERPVFHDSLAEVAATFTCGKTGFRSKYAPSTPEVIRVKPWNDTDILEQIRKTASSGNTYQFRFLGCGPDRGMLWVMSSLYATAPELGSYIVIDGVEEDIDLLRAAAAQITSSARCYYANLHALLLTQGNAASMFRKDRKPDFESVSNGDWMFLEVEAAHD